MTSCIPPQVNKIPLLKKNEQLVPTILLKTEYEQSNLKVAYRFCDENDNEGEVFSILLVVPAREPESFWRENVIAICHSTTGFSRRRQ